MTSAPVGCGGDVECDETMEVSYSDQPMFNDEIPDGELPSFIVYYTFLNFRIKQCP